jgi:hypothetical protein
LPEFAAIPGLQRTTACCAAPGKRRTSQTEGDRLELEHADSANAPLAVDRLYAHRRRQLHCHGAGTPPSWLVYSPLPFLFLLMFSGLYMFALPYAAKRRSR